MAKGIRTWDRAGKEEQQRFVMAMFDQAQVRISYNAFPMAGNAVDFVNIFCHFNRAEMKKWRLATKTKFFCFFDGAIEHIHRPVSRGEPENCQSLFDIWQNHMRSSAIKNLDLGTIDNVPTLPSRSVSSATLKLNKLGKTPDVNAIEEEDDDEDEEMMSEGSTEIDYDESVTMG